MVGYLCLVWVEFFDFGFHVLPASLTAFDVVFDCLVGRAADAAKEFAATPEVPAPVTSPKLGKPLKQTPGTNTLQFVEYVTHTNRRLKT